MGACFSVVCIGEASLVGLALNALGWVFLEGAVVRLRLVVLAGGFLVEEVRARLPVVVGGGGRALTDCRTELDLESFEGPTTALPIDCLAGDWCAADTRDSALAGF